MSQGTSIEWTDATWNPIRGCSRVSEGCRHCYAESVAYRFSGPGQPYEGLVHLGPDGKRGKGAPRWNGQIRFVEEHLLDPLRWRKPRRIFVNSMSDLFHENVTEEMLDRIFAVMALCPQHTFQVLTKRPERMLAYFNREDGGNYSKIITNPCAWFVWSELTKMQAVAKRAIPSRAFTWAEFDVVDTVKGWPLPNVWLGVSVENQKAADERIPLLLETPAAVRFISAEPLLESVAIPDYVWLPRTVTSDLPFPPFLRALPGLHRATRNPLGAVSVTVDGKQLGVKPDEYENRKLDWVICGGESGPGARPMHPDWARSLRDQCKAAGVPFFFKQWGEWAPWQYVAGKKVYLKISVPSEEQIRPGTREIVFTRTDVADEERAKTSVNMLRVGKKTAGHLLDGEVIQQFPEVRG